MATGRRDRTTAERIAGLAMRVVVLVVGVFIALDTTSRAEADSGAIYLSIVFVAFGLGLTVDGVASVVRRR